LFVLLNSSLKKIILNILPGESDGTLVTTPVPLSSLMVSIGRV